MNPALARQQAREICHPYLSHETADELRNIRRLTEGVEPGELEVTWESEHTDLGWVTLSTWLLSAKGPHGVMWRNYDGDGDLTTEVFIYHQNLEQVEFALRKAAS